MIPDGIRHLSVEVERVELFESSKTILVNGELVLRLVHHNFGILVVLAREMIRRGRLEGIEDKRLFKLVNKYVSPDGKRIHFKNKESLYQAWRGHIRAGRNDSRGKHYMVHPEVL